MITINSKKIIDTFNLKPFGQKGWLYDRKMKCPYCGREGKFGFTFNAKPGIVHCFYCDKSTSIVNFLKQVGKTSLMSFDREISINREMKYIEKKRSRTEEKIDLEEIRMPRGWKRIYEDEYLESRGYTKQQFEIHPVGVVKSIFSDELDHYLVFPIYQHKKIVAWLARTRYSYSWHKKNLEDSKENKVRLLLRYRNSNNDFSKILGGLDEITDKTNTIILVEGWFDKLNVDRLLNLYSQDKVKCVCTFGNSVKEDQRNLLKQNAPSLKRIVLMYDAGTVSQTKQFGMSLSKKYQVDVAELLDPDIDPGNITAKELKKVLKNLKSIDFYCLNRLNHKL